MYPYWYIRPLRAYRERWRGIMWVDSSNVPCPQSHCYLVGYVWWAWGDHIQEATMECSYCKKPANRTNSLVVLKGDGTEKYTHYTCIAPPYNEEHKTRDRKPLTWTRKWTCAISKRSSQEPSSLQSFSPYSSGGDPLSRYAQDVTYTSSSPTGNCGQLRLVHFFMCIISICIKQ